MPASYPSSTKSFPTRSTGQTIADTWFNDPQDEIVAIENGLRTGLQHHLIFSPDNTYDIGASGATRPRTGYFATALALGTNPASAGLVRLANAGKVSSRNAANSADVDLIHLDSGDRPQLGSSTSGFFERARTVAAGAWTTVAYSDANFTGDGTDANWVVDDTDEVVKYTLLGKTVIFLIDLGAFTIANTPAELRIAIPSGLTPNVAAGGTIYLNDGTAATGRWNVVASGTDIKLTKIGASWSNITNGGAIQAIVIYETT